MTNIFAHEHLIGTLVHCKVRGNGRIIAPTTGGDYPVKVEFDTDIEYFTEDGKSCIWGKYPTLSFGYKDNYTHDYGTAPEKSIEYPALFELIEDSTGRGTIVLFTTKTAGTVLSTTKELYKVGDTSSTWTPCTNTRVWKQIKFSTLDK